MLTELCIVFNAVGVAANAWFIVYLMKKSINLSARIQAIEHAHYMREWLSAIESGESPSDMAYMKQKGFLK